MNPKVDFFFNKASKWQQEYEKLRQIAIDCHLSEELKWGCPCYTINGNNVVLIHGFKEYCALLFFKGALMKDPKNILNIQTENTQATRQIRFTNLIEIMEMENDVRDYIQQAIEIEHSGKKVTFKKTTEFKMPEEFSTRLESIPKLKSAFYSLTPGRQRAYLLYFSSAKQSKTREARIDNYMNKILEGKGLDD